ncbi:RNA 2'-phosphotransferase [Roseateles sp. NT4]|uniref:RNA 2'-phosphotransferase n=1 Tax=Roseateles sp. NT4 TaxID=3453715 RepID=UPI003EEE12F5
MGENEKINEMNSKSQLTSVSKFLSLVLRHEPHRIGITLDEAGWTLVDELLLKAAAVGRPISRDLLDEIVAGSDKQRFAFSEDGLCIRSNQGHSIEIDLDLPTVEPPDVLFHGTALRFIESILKSGLERRERHHVHLTQDRQTAAAVGQRYGQPVILRIDARAMSARGHQFRCSANSVWLTDAVPVEFIQVDP